MISGQGASFFRNSSCAHVVFVLKGSFYPTTSAHPVPVLILHPREIQIIIMFIMWSQTAKQSEPKPKQSQSITVKRVKC